MSAEKNEHMDSVRISRRYMDSLLIESRIVGAVRPSSRVTVLGRMFETPIMPGALSHLKGGMAGYAAGAKLAGALCSVGMGSVEELAFVCAACPDVIKVIKPYADREQVFARIRAAERFGAFGVGMDVEHAVNPDDDRDSLVVGEQMRLPSLQELAEYVRCTSLPFFIKGALSVQDALRCRELGCAGVILSHHNGLMRWAVPPVMLLPEIRRAVGDDLLLIADGGIADGYDAFKALALGADLVCTGRPLMEPYASEGSEGVAKKLRQMTGELRGMMLRTGAADLRQIDPGVIRQVSFLG